MAKNYEYYIPGFAKSAWQLVREDDIHPGLAMYRFFEKNKKDESLNRITKLVPDRTGLILAVRRQEDQLLSLKQKGYEVLKWTQTSDTRLVCGLGIPSLAENGLLMDRVWGFPYIPGSALKGIAQDQALMELTGDYCDGNKRRDAKRLSKNFIACFGAQGAEHGHRLDIYWEALKGQVIFMNAFMDPNTGKPFEIDVVNQHYRDYYLKKGTQPPADYLSPNPNFFIVLKDNIKFHFAVAARNVNLNIKDKEGESLEIDCEAKSLCYLVANWLQTAAIGIGIGGKTRVGYGYFKDDINYVDLNGGDCS